MNIRKVAGYLLAILGATTLAACEDPKPGLENPEREVSLSECRQKLGGPPEWQDKMRALCDCTVGRLDTQGLTLDDLRSVRRERALENVRWCARQVGIEAPPEATPSDDVEEETPEGSPAEGAE